jgi:hypothetical protein
MFASEFCRAVPIVAGPAEPSLYEATPSTSDRALAADRRKELARYSCDPRRLYDIWEEKRFPASREKARALFLERYPGLVDRIDYGRHRTIPRKPPAELQPGLFDGLEPAQR